MNESTLDYTTDIHKTNNKRKIMKKQVAIILVVCIIIGFLTGIVVGLWKKDNTNWITDSDYLYDKAIEYIVNLANSNEHNKNKEDYKLFTDYNGFGIEGKEDKKYVYMWIHKEDYYVEHRKLMADGGSSMPYKFTFENDEVIKYETPKDGTLYAQSIKDMMPDSIENKVISYSMNSEKIKQEVQEYYSYLESTEIYLPYESTYRETPYIKIEYASNGNYEIKEVYDTGENKIKTFGGDITITINNKQHSLKEALEQKVITENDILEQAKADVQKGICKTDIYMDGGSIVYWYEDCSILKLNRLSGEKDLIIGMAGDILNLYDKYK